MPNKIEEAVDRTGEAIAKTYNYADNKIEDTANSLANVADDTETSFKNNF